MNQAWFIDQRWYSYARQPYGNSRKFQIRTKMSGGRALGWWNHFGSHQYYVKLQDHAPFMTNQWWFIDHRTKSIRAFSKRNYALSNQINYKHRQNYYVNIRPWRNEPYQKILFRGQRIVNHANLCLMPRNGRNYNKNYITFWMCKNSNNQYWFTDTRGVYFPRYPLRDGVRFQIKSQMTGNRALFYHEHIGAYNYRLRIRNNYPEDIKQWWVFDWRTRSIRAQGNRAMAISIQYNHNNWYSNSYAAVVARYTGKYIQRIRWFNGSNRNIRDVGVRCLNVVGRSNTHHRHVSWYRCQNGGWQAWKIDTKGITYPRYPIRNGVKFQIRTRMNSKRPLRAYINSYVRLVDNNPYDRYQWFVFDWRTKTIRTIVNRAYVIQAYNSFNQGTYAQIRYFRKQPTQYMQWHEGSRRNIRHNRGLCMDVRGNRDKHLEYIIWYRCHNGLNQAWFLDQSGPQYRSQPFNDGVRFMIRSRMASNRALYHHYTHIGSHQYKVLITTALKGEWRQWWTFDSRTKSIRAWTRRNYALSNYYGRQFRIYQQVVIRPWRNEHYQKISYFPGSRQNLRSPAGYCLDVYKARNRNDEKVIYWICHNGANQAWFLDRRPLYYRRYPLRDGIKFQIKSRMSTNRALFWHEHVGGYQYRLRIMNNNPSFNKQWWVFDWRSRTIRSFANRNFAISIRRTVYSFYKNGYDAVVTNYRSTDYYQRMRMFPGYRRNIRNVLNKCLDVHGAHNSHHRHVIWHQCHNGANQGWYIDRVGYRYPRYPLASGVKFQIKSRMPTNRALFWHEHIGSNQYRLRIRDNNPENNKQWWTFDDRTKTIRAWARRNFVIANQQGYAFRIGVAATIRVYRNTNYQRIRWYNGRYRNIRNNGRKCLDVYGASNTNMRHVTFWNCHNGINQQWYIDQQGISYPRQPLPDGRRFQIRSRMSGNRALFWREHIGSYQYMLRIRDHWPGEGKQWFFFDRRTRTIRAAEKRSYVIANRLGRGYQVGHAAVIRPWRGEIYQKSAFYGGRYRNIRNNAQKCLDVYRARNVNQMHTIFWNCHNGLNQAWYIDTQGVRYPRQPYGDNTRFQIRSRLPKRRNLVVTEHIGGYQYRLRIRDQNTWNINQWFYFDRRTRTIRSAGDRRRAISGRQGYGYRNAMAAVVRVYRNHANQKVVFWGGAYRNIRNNGRQCLDVAGSSDTQNRHTIWYKCHNGRNQAWWLDPKAIRVPRYPLRDGVKFQIKSTMRYNRALFTSENIGSYQYRLRIQNNNPDDRRQWWTFDYRTRSIRSFWRRNYAISNQYGQGYNIGRVAVSRIWRNEIYQKMRWFNYPRRTIRTLNGKCLDVYGGRNVHNRHVTFWNCHNGLNQGWKIDQIGWRYPRQPINDNTRFQIKSSMKEHRALFRHEHIGGNQYRLRIRDNNPECIKQWFIFNKRTRTIRSADNRRLVISNQQGYRYRIGVAAVMRYWRSEVYQRIAYYSGSRRNLRNNGGKCLDVYGNSNTDYRHTTFWNCHNGLNQAWWLDRNHVRYHRYPLRDGIRFQIKTLMRSRRALFYHEHIGHGQYRLRIRNNQPKNNRQWFVFDWRTKTIRAAADRRMTLSNQYNYRFRIGVAAVMRPYRNSFYQRIHWVSGHRRNIQNNGRKCLDVHGGSDSNMRHVIFWNCHNGLNQAWRVDRKFPQVRYPPYPLRDGIRFQLKSRMSGNRALYWRNHIGGNQYRCYIQDNNPMDNRQWWTFDWRTKTIRAYARRGYALSGRYGSRLRRGNLVVIRPYRGDGDQKIWWYNTYRKNVRFGNKVCLDVHGAVNRHNRWVIYWSCHNGLNQAWYIDQTRYSYPRQPLADGQRFQIRSRMAGFRALVWHENIGGAQYRLRIRNYSCRNSRAWFTFDKRTRTVRAYAARGYAISNRRGYGFRINAAAVVRQYRNEVYQRLSYYGGSRRNFRNVAGKCLDVHGGRNSNMRHVIFWNCHNGANQGWFYQTRCPKPKK